MTHTCSNVGFSSKLKTVSPKLQCLTWTTLKQTPRLKQYINSTHLQEKHVSHVPLKHFWSSSMCHDVCLNTWTNETDIKPAEGRSWTWFVLHEVLDGMKFMLTFDEVQQKQYFYIQKSTFIFCKGLCNMSLSASLISVWKLLADVS